MQAAHDCFVCPQCTKTLTMPTQEEYHCGSCNKKYPILNGVVYFLSEPPNQVPYQQIWKTDERSSASSITNAKPSIIDFQKNVLGKFNFSGKILEVGAGLCWASLLLKKKNPSCQMFSSDISLQALQKGKAIAQNKGVKIDYSMVCRVERLPFANDFFDYVFGSSILIYTNLPLALKELRRVLKKGGYYIGIRECASSPIFTPFYNVLYARKSDEYASLTQLHSYKKWMNALKHAGFNLYQINPCRDAETKASASTSWYQIINNVPDIFTRNMLFSEIHILMKK
jgi:SAM-dependent methyltransferase